MEKEFCNAGQKGSLQQFLQLLRNEKIDVNSLQNGYTALMYACWQGQLEIVKLLLEEKRVRLNEVSYFGETAFYFACWHGQIEIIKCMLKDHRVNINQANYYGETPLMIATFWGRVEVIKWMLASDRFVNVKLENNAKKTALTIAKLRGEGDQKNWEGVEELKSRQQNCNEIYQLLDQYQINRKQTVYNLQKELLILGNFLITIF